MNICGVHECMYVLFIHICNGMVFDHYKKRNSVPPHRNESRLIQVIHIDKGRCYLSCKLALEASDSETKLNSDCQWIDGQAEILDKIHKLSSKI